MNLRDLKKDIDYIFSAFVEDCCYVAAKNPKLTTEKANELIDEAVEIYNGLRDKAAKAEGPARQYYAALSKEVMEKGNAIYDKLSAAIKNA